MTERRRASGPDGRPSEEPNPFAAPPEGAPEQPWEHRRHDTGDGQNSGDAGDAGSRGDGPDGEEGGGRRTPWGRQWSSRQPRRQSGGFGQSPEERPEPDGRDGPRWDPSDTKQRHARYAALAGGWALLSALLGWEWLTLFLLAFSFYWGVNALRGRPPKGSAAAAKTDPAARRAGTVWAVSGVVMAALALTMVAANFTVQMIYSDYFACAQDALTTPSREACEDLLPEVLHPIYVNGG